MKELKKTLASMVAVALTIGALSGCGDKEDEESSSDNSGLFKPKYSADCDFFYSSDKGHTYGDGTKEYEIGDTVYMKVKYKVTSNKKKNSQVKVVLTIPSIDNVDAKYMDGQIITPNFDAVNNVTTYEFTANASKEAAEQECVIQFVPNAAGDISMTLVFDDNVDPSYDKKSTLAFVEPPTEATTTSITTTTTTTTTSTTTEATTTSTSEDTSSVMTESSTDTTTTAVDEEKTTETTTEEE